ncbi:MAG: GDP-mannose 4,6-dehydratase [Candidatus Coatesbacteria bacterium]|nr:GDP-mannose 4,6-dehydratase [Candidatus Coatesbacteria bacterium]
MHVLITGGAGFIGSHLAESLLDRGYKVTIIDNLSTGSFSNIRGIENNPNLKILIDTVTNEMLIEKIINECDLIYHLAAAVGVKLVMEQPIFSLENNILGTEIILRLAARYRKKVFIVSSSEVYGKSSQDSFKESDDLVIGATIFKRWAYAASKAIDEFMAMAYYHEQNTPVIIVRLFNTVGPRQTGRYGMVIPRFIDQAYKNEDITVYGDGKQSRCFTYVEDVTKSLISLSEKNEAIGNVINIGSDEEVSILDLANRIIRMLDSRSSIRFIPYNEVYGQGFEDMHRRKPDTSLLRSLIDFNDLVSLDNILKIIIKSKGF